MSILDLVRLPGGIRRGRLEVAGGPLALLDTGEPVPATGRRPVVLVPGYTGSKEDFASLLRPLAAPGRRVVAYDQRGQHESPGPDDPAAYRVAELAGELLEVLAWLDAGPGGGPAHVVGHSFGGLVARAAALARPAAFASLTLLDSGPGAVDGLRAERIRRLRPVLDHEGLPAVWQRLQALAATEGASPPPAEVGAFLRTRFLASSPVGLREMGQHLLDEPDRVAELARTGIPLLVCHGETDDAWSPAVQADMARRLRARHVSIPGAAHSPNVEAPDVTAATLTAFWSDLEDG